MPEQEECCFPQHTSNLLYILFIGVIDEKDVDWKLFLRGTEGKMLFVI